MGVNVSGCIVTVRVCHNQCLITGEYFFHKFQTKCLCLFSGKITFRCICRIKADDVMMTFDLGRFLILVKPGICDLTFFIERQRIAIQSVHVEFFTENAPVKFIQDLFSCLFIMLKKQVINGSGVISISAFDVLKNCHLFHLPFAKPVFVIGKVLRCTDGFQIRLQGNVLRHC